MSTTDRHGFKIVLPRTGADEFWQVIHENYAGQDAQNWKRLAMLALRENAGWPLDAIGQVFGHNKGTVSKNISHLKEQLRQQFKLSPDLCTTPELMYEDRDHESGFSDPE